jgi:hypothetical protein
MAGIAFAVALCACAETGSTSNPSTAGGAGGVSGGAGGVGLAGFGGASGLGAAGASTAGTGGAPSAGTSGGFAGVGGAAGTFGAGGSPGTSGMGAGTGGMPGTSGTGAGTGGMPGTSGMGGTGGMSGAGGQGGMGSSGPTFAPVYAIIMAKCGGGLNGCHVTGSSGNLRMPNAAMAYDNLVGVASSECSGEMRVVAGNADDSLLVQAIEGTACVDQMPDGRAALPAGEIAMFRAWIDGGARE